MAHEFDGKKYEAASFHQQEWGKRLLDDLQLDGSERILDLGCGDGSLTRRIADRVPEGRVLGIDASQGMIDAALPKRRSNLQFQKADINQLAFENEFDVVFSNAALHWVKDHQRLLQSIHRALVEGGRLRFQFAGRGNCAHLYQVVQALMTGDSFQEPFAEFEWPWYMPSVGEYKDLAERSELIDLQIWSENADRYFPNVDAMIRWIDQPSLVPFLRHLPPAMRDSFRKRVVSQMIQLTKQTDGRCFETFRRINVSAQKRPAEQAT